MGRCDWLCVPLGSGDCPRGGWPYLRPLSGEVPPSVGCLRGTGTGSLPRTTPTALPVISPPSSMDILQLLLFSFISLAPCFCNLRGFFEFRSHVFQTFAEPLRERLVCPAVWAGCPWCSWPPPVCLGRPFHELSVCERDGSVVPVGF